MSDALKAEELAGNFAKTCEAEPPARINATTRRFNSTLRNLSSSRPNTDEIPLITVIDVTNEIRMLKSRKASEPDRVTNRCLKQLPSEGISLLTKIFNACLKLQYFPSSWKSATVIAIRKAGKPPQDPTNYRPISLLSALGKLFERLLLARIQVIVDEAGIVQSFMKGKSTTLQLFRVVKKLKANMRAKMTTGMLCVDLKSAFDSVWHKGLIHKLAIIRLPTLLYI